MNRNKSTLPSTTHLLIPDEVAEIFRVNRKTVYKWIHDGKLETIRIPGGGYRFEASYIKTLAETLEENP